MGTKSKRQFNPCAASKAQRLPAKIWELLRRNEPFRTEVKRLSSLDQRARKEASKYCAIASQYNQAIANKDAKLAKYQQRYERVKHRPARSKAFALIESHQQMHPLAAVALQWLVPEPLFFANRKRDGHAEEGSGCFPDPNNPSWTWWRNDTPQGAVGHYRVRGPEIAGHFEEWQNWHLGQSLFQCETSWNRLPKSFKAEFIRVWRENYDSMDAVEFEYLHPPRTTAKLTRADAARYLNFWDIISRHRLFAISPAILTTKDVGDVFGRLQNQIKKSLPESREHIFGTESAWRHYIAIRESGLSLQAYIIAGNPTMDSSEIRDKARNHRRNVQFGVKAIEDLIDLVYPTFQFKKAALVHSAPPRDKIKRRKPRIASVLAPKPAT